VELLISSLVAVNLFSASKVERRYPSLNPLVLYLIPSIEHDSPFIPRDSPTERHFWNFDIEKMAEMIDSYKRDISEQKPGAIQALIDFKDARRKALRDIKAVCILFSPAFNYY
jgi:hypothetical protein